MSRVVRFEILLVALAGCAHLDPGAREPARAPASAAAEAELQRVGEVYRREVVNAAFVMTDPDPRGARRPRCTLDLAGRRDLVPTFLNLAPGAARAAGAGLPACDAAQTAHAATLASTAAGVTCALNFALSEDLGRTEARRAPRPGPLALAATGVICTGPAGALGYGLVPVE